MKCPKCEYLGFEASDRCRNCGYEFSLDSAAPAFFDLPIEAESAEPVIPVDVRPQLDLDRIIGAPPEDLPLFGDTGPMITTPSPPRAPLSVRRTTPEIPRARIKTPRSADDSLFETPPAAVFGYHAGLASGGEAPASPVTRIMAALIDLALLATLDAGVIYFTLRLLGLSLSELLQLPSIPLAAFFLILNGGYFIAFTAVGGQSIGKMALGIKVISEEGAVPIGRATLRTLAYLLSALPLGAGFLPGVMGDRLALHDRLAHTRVVRPL
ncbi:MAG: RDD family protein [Vicinamibacterales bacterium]|nr:RDD family protein [Vicinamibacterales bacterium]